MGEMVTMPLWMVSVIAFACTLFGGLVGIYAVVSGIMRRS